MARFIKRRSKKAGLPPGTLMHIGETKTARSEITAFAYDEAHVRECKMTDNIDACRTWQADAEVAWINVSGIHDIDVIRRLGDMFSLHPLVLEDILNTAQRPKLEDHGDYLYVVFKMIYEDAKTAEIVTEQVSLVLFPHLVLSFQERPGDVFDAVRERIRSGAGGRIRKSGADYLCYALVDAIVDNYFLVLEVMDETIDTLEEELIAAPTRNTLHRIQHLLREVIFLRRSIWPLRSVVDELRTGAEKFISSTTRIYLKDVYDHVVEIVESIEVFREVLAGNLDTYLSTASNTTNDIMRFLTVISTVFIPLTFMTGVYGMNFRFMPELAWPWAYPVVLIVMGVIGVSMIVYFRRKNWF